MLTIPTRTIRPEARKISARPVAGLLWLTMTAWSLSAAGQSSAEQHQQGLRAAEKAEVRHQEALAEKDEAKRAALLAESAQAEQQARELLTGAAKAKDRTLAFVNDYAEFLCRKNVPDQAIEALQGALKETGEGGPLAGSPPGELARAYRRLGALLERAGRWEAAIAEYRQALKVCPGDKKTRLYLGVVLAGFDEFEEARQLLTGLIIEPPWDPLAAYTLGVMDETLLDYAAAAGNYKDAEERARVVAEETKRPYPWTESFRAARQRAALKAAELKALAPAARQKTQENRDTARQLLLTGLALEHQAGLDLQEVPSGTEAPRAEQIRQRNQAVLQKRAEIDRCYEKAAATCVEFQRAFFHRGRFLWRCQSYRRAGEFLDLAVALNPEHLQARHLLAQAFFSLGQSEKALEQWTALLRLQPEYGFAYGGIAHARALRRNSLEELRQALDDYRQARRYGVVFPAGFAEALEERIKWLQEHPAPASEKP